MLLGQLCCTQGPYGHDLQMPGPPITLPLCARLLTWQRSEWKRSIWFPLEHLNFPAFSTRPPLDSDDNAAAALPPDAHSRRVKHEIAHCSNFSPLVRADNVTKLVTPIVTSVMHGTADVHTYVHTCTHTSEKSSQVKSE